MKIVAKVANNESIPPLKQEVLEQVRNFQVPATNNTILAALRFKYEIDFNKALLNLLYAGAIEALPFEDATPTACIKLQIRKETA